jgi:hypothetical protein
MPVNRIAGKEMKLPPPATALSTPPMALAQKIRIAFCAVTGSLAQLGINPKLGGYHTAIRVGGIGRTC